MVHYPVTEQFRLALCTVNYGPVLEWVTRVIPHLFSHDILNFGTAMIIEVFHLFIQ